MAPLWRSTIFGTCPSAQVPKILGLGGVLLISHEPLGVFPYKKSTGCHKFDEDYGNVGLFQKESFLVTKQSSHGHYRQKIISIIYLERSSFRKHGGLGMPLLILFLDLLWQKHGDQALAYLASICRP
jgi:hypothetical protein